jgi:hypothetical protein
MEYWVPEVDVTGVHELVGNALNLPGQNDRPTNLRAEEFEELQGESEGDADEG